ncbi:hypothetical protein SCLCIDRAFT_18255 [Scleroderma citrinum Foug A]|uniref:Uncharacterized protein n=1 Tax=Scleroderma citrinum Foug A TaxID=1036808 RepID=A0A0C3D6Z0_9AGAM|nr:hypothetical protein SCLCIDRAFT_18255 [Scleroderma citrinum Foug A]
MRDAAELEAGASYVKTPSKHRRSDSSDSFVSSTVTDSSKRPERRSRHTSRSRSPSYSRRRSKSRSRSREKDSRKSKRKDKERDRKGRRKEKEKKKDKDERRSVLTGKKIKLKVHKGSKDLEMDANRQDLLQFLNSTC